MSKTHHIVYRGFNDKHGEETVEKHIDGINVVLAPRYDLRNHSPDGFAWGYNGSGPAQLALAMLADAFEGNDKRALEYYQAFKDKYISRLDKNEPWEMTKEQVIEAVVQLEAATDA